MKKTLFLWALLCLSITGQSQTLKSIKQDLQKVVDQVDALIKAGEPKPEEPKGDSCKRGPIPQEIYNITQKGATVLFDAQDVYGWDYTITQNGTSKGSGKVSPKSNRESITFSIDPGDYVLELKGNTCLSKVYSKPFTVPKPTGDNGGDGNPVPDVTIFPLTQMTEGFKEHLDLQFKDDKDDTRLMTDTGTEGKSVGYVFRYLINGHQIDSETRLKDYPIAGNNPVRVLVGKLKKDYLNEGFNKWGSAPSDYGHFDGNGKWIEDGWYKRDAGETFSFNTSYAFQTFVAKGKQDAKGFLNHVPQNYDPSDQQISWGDIGEEIALPKGKHWIADWRPWGIDRVFKLGVTNLPHHSLPWNDADGNREVKELKNAGKTFTNYQRIEAVFNRSNNGSPELWPNGTSKAVWPTADGLPLEEAARWGRETDASDALWISEMSENVGWQPNGSPMFGAFYPELKKRYEQNFGSRGIPYEICHNYFWLGGESLSRGHSADYFKRLFHTEPKDLPRSEFSPGGTLSSTTLIVEGVYLNAPDLVLRQPIHLFFRLNYFKQMGYHAGVVLFGQGETRPNNRYKIRFDDGDYYKVDKFPLDPNVHIASIFFGLTEGNVVGEWGGFGKSNKKLFDGRPGQQLFGDWFPKGSKEPRNNEFNKAGYDGQDIYHGFTGSQDLTYFAVRLYAKTFGQTDGGTRKFLRFRIDGGGWIQVENDKINDVINAYDQSRGWVLSQYKDGKIAWYYHNSFADNSWHKLDVEFPNGKIVTQRVAGNGIHAKIEDL